MSTKRWILVIAAVLIPPTLFLLILALLGWLQPQSDLGTLGALLASYGLWAGFLAAIVQISGYSLKDLFSPEAQPPPPPPPPTPPQPLIPTTAPIITTPFNLPAPVPDFTGRDEQIQELRQELEKEGMVTIYGLHGMGGIGKTELALYVADQIAAAGRFSDARLYINLRGTNPEPLEPAAALNALISALLGPDPRRPQDLEALSNLWRAALHGKDAVLLLDNAASAAQVRPLLPGSARCAVLVTSRQRFALPGAAGLDLRRLPEAEARALLQRLAPRLDDAEADEIAGSCGCLPLALRIAGNYLAINDDCPPARYAGLLAEERDRLSHLRVEGDPDRDVGAAINLSLAQLDGDLRRDWALLALFPAPFDQPAAAALWGAGTGEVEALAAAETLDRLQAVRNRSLLSYDGETGRYQQHDLLRLAAASALEDLSDVDPARRHLAGHYLARAEEVQQSQRYLDLDPDWPHLQAALQYAAREEAPIVSLLSDLVSALPPYWSARGMAREWAVWSLRAAELCSAAGRRRDEGGHLGNLGLAYAGLGEVRTAIDYYEQALAIAQEIGDRRGEGNALGNLGNAYADLGEVRTAIDYCEQALAIAQEIGDRRGEGARLGSLGLAYADLGEVRTAIDYYEKSLAIKREIGDRRREGNSLGNLGLAYADLGEVRTAIDYHEQALAISQEIGDRRGEGQDLGNLGSAYYRLGEVEKAAENYQQQLDITREIGDRRGEARALWGLGLCYRDKADTPRARESSMQALRLLEAIEDPNAERVRGLVAELDE